MHAKTLLLLLPLLGSLVQGCGKLPDVSNVITPQPLEVVRNKGSLDISSPFRLDHNLEDPAEGSRLKELLADAGLSFDENGGRVLKLSLVSDTLESQSAEGYRMVIDDEGVSISSPSPAGIFYGVQSLVQLIEKYGASIPAVTVKDRPRFGYRGIHLDVSRHFFDKAHVKKQLDAMARYKINTLHWHLTDAAGWRIETDSYPLLTEVAAWRAEPNYLDWLDNGGRYVHRDTPGAYGGYFTKEDIKEVVEHARRLHITVIPEIEMPGHSAEVLAVYPELSCSGKPYVDADLCIGNEQTFMFLERLLAEVFELFPSQYIHVGGDEATKLGWKTCPKCRARMEKEGLADLDELQGYMMRRIDGFLRSHGRKLIGWDEILDGGLPSDAVVMSWRGVAGGFKAIAAGHPAIMTPDAYCYYDFYQDAPPTQPVAMASFTPLAKAYSYDPAPDSLPREQRNLVMGPQGNLWAEYIPTAGHAEYMLYPRLLALAEVGWSTPENKSYDLFHQRALAQVDRLRAHGYNPFDLKNEIGPRPESLTPADHIGTGAKVTYIDTDYPEKYSAGGDGALTDGLRGGWNYADGRWQGYKDQDMEVVIDLSRETRIGYIGAVFMQEAPADIWAPAQIEYAVSTDGQNFVPLSVIRPALEAKDRRRHMDTYAWEGGAGARFVRVRAESNGTPGGWIFTDEIIIE